MIAEENSSHKSKSPSHSVITRLHKLQEELIENGDRDGTRIFGQFLFSVAESASPFQTPVNFHWHFNCQEHLYVEPAKDINMIK
jgi:uncharacterized protein YdgA (DUF945 family)